jgi:hypothetical protein
VATEQPARAVESVRSYQAARQRRADLLRAIHGLERAVASPGGAPTWRQRVDEQLSALGEQLAEHIVVTEGTEGLYGELLAHAPRLDRQVNGLTDDHGVLQELIGSLVSRVRDQATGIDELRRLATELLGELARHRQRGADLVYEAYATDIGGET